MGLGLGVLDRPARCFSDHRNPNGVEHGVRSLAAQCIYALALGYEDLNDREALRADSLLALWVGKAEHLPKGPKPRFVVTNLSAECADARHLYEELHRIRGDRENCIKGAPGELAYMQPVKVRREGEGQPPLPPRVMGLHSRGWRLRVDRGASRQGK